MGLNAPQPIAGHDRRRRARRREAGLTLPELLVSLVILSLIGGAMAGAFTISLKVVGTGATKDYLAGNQDLLSLEQQVGKDASRAGCIVINTTTYPTGGCTGLFNSGHACAANSQLCLGWYDAQVGATTCHVISYTEQVATDVVLRVENVLTTSTSTTTTQRFTTSGLLVTASATTSSANGYTWPTSVMLAATQSGAPSAAPRPVSATFHLTPLITDPLSPVTGTGTGPC